MLRKAFIALSVAANLLVVAAIVWLLVGGGMRFDRDVVHGPLGIGGVRLQREVHVLGQPDRKLMRRHGDITIATAVRQ